MHGILTWLAFLRLVTCSQSVFSVHNDLLAYPQFEVIYSETFISSAEAEARLAFAESPSQALGDEYVAAAAPADGSRPDLSYDLETREWKLDGVRHPSSSKETYEKMILNGRPYLCTLPHVSDTNPNNTKPAASQEEQQQELMRASENGWQLLKGMQGTCLYWPTYRRSWWVYSFCYNEAIRQFHPLDPARGGSIFPPVEDPHVPSFSLATFEDPRKKRETSEESDSGGQDVSTKPVSDAPASQLQTRGETNFLVQRLGGGTVCDLTGHERRVEVQFHCNPTLQDRIRMIKETASCVYLIVIETPRLCNDVAFRPPQIDKPHPITCQEIVAPEGVPQWKASKAAQAANALFKSQAQEAENSEGPLIIGDIEVGGQKLVGGSPEKTIKASKIVAAIQRQGAGSSQGGEREIAVLAKSDGKNLYMTTVSEREMKNLGLETSPQDVQRWIAYVQKVAEGQPWKLVAVKTPEGVVEFKAILGADDDPPPGQKGTGTSGQEGGAKEKKRNQEVGSEEEYR